LGAGVAAVAFGVVVVGAAVSPAPGVAVPPVVEAAAPSVGFAPQLAAPLALALGAALGAGAALVSVAGVFDEGVSPPHAVMTAEVPRAASVAARVESVRFGRILFSLSCQ
jgi:hypothetical protein